MTREVLASTLPDDPWWRELLHSYFPHPVRERFADQIDLHPLRREIISTMIANEVVNHGGITMIYRIQEETNAPLADIVRSYAMASAIFGTRSFFLDTEAIGDLPTRYDTHIEFRRLLERAVRWLVPWHESAKSIASIVERYRDTATYVTANLRVLLQGKEAQRHGAEFEAWQARGLAPDLAERVAGLLDSYSALDIADIMHEFSTSQPSSHEVASAYFTLSELFDIDALLLRVAKLPRTDRWESLARSSMRADLYAALADLTRSVLTASAASLDEWQRENAALLGRVRTILDEVSAAESVDLALLSVALRTIRGSLARHRS
jgi:glutamate dehydrogenase